MSIYKPQVRRFCKEFENIENYQEAVSSPEKYDCHHRLEEIGLSRKDLIDKEMYYNRPASELIFLTHKAHISLHKKGNKNFLGKIHSIETKKKMSDAQKGENHPMYGKHHSIETKKKMSANNKGENNPHYKFICPIKLIYMYCKQEMSAYRIAKELMVDGNVIRRRLKELNIPIRKKIVIIYIN